MVERERSVFRPSSAKESPSISIEDLRFEEYTLRRINGAATVVLSGKKEILGNAERLQGGGILALYGEDFFPVVIILLGQRGVDAELLGDGIEHAAGVVGLCPFGT